MIELLLMTFKSYENFVLPGVAGILLLIIWQLYFNVQGNYLSRFEIINFAALINGVFLLLGAVIAKYAFIFPLENFTSFCFRFGKAAYLFIFILFIWLTVLLGHFFTRLLFRQFNYGFQRGKRFTAILASFYLPTIIGLLFLIITDCGKMQWFAWQSYHAYGTGIFLFPNLISFVPQVLITTQYVDKKKKIRQ
jgi:hypothetical protein